MTLLEILKLVDPHFAVSVFDQNGIGFRNSDDKTEEEKNRQRFLEMTVTSIRPGLYNDLIVTVHDPEQEVKIY